MKYIKPGDVIGVTAPSDGNKKDTDLLRLENAKKNLSACGYVLKETPNVRVSEKGRSGSAKERAAEFMDLIRDPSVSSIICAKGGDFLVEMLPFLDWDEIRKHPKWIQGYSDNTGIVYPITTLLDQPTIYGSNFNDFGMAEWHPSLAENQEILEGKRKVQESYSFYEPEFGERVTGLESYNTTEPVRLALVSDSQDSPGEAGEICIKGRLLGGCMDVLVNLLGTPYDGTAEYIKRHQGEGILWYMETFALSAERLTTGLWQMKQAGWFKEATGFLFGRPCFFSSDYEIGFEEAVKSVLGDLKVPIVTGADIGHRAPRWTMVNGWMTEFIYKEGRGRLQYELDRASENS